MIARQRNYGNTVHVRLDASIQRRLEEMTERTSLSASECCRRLVEKGLAVESENDNLRSCMELLQAMRTEVLTFFRQQLGSTDEELKEITRSAEAMAAAQLESFLARRSVRLSVRDFVRNS